MHRGAECILMMAFYYAVKNTDPGPTRIFIDFYKEKCMSLCNEEQKVIIRWIDKIFAEKLLNCSGHISMWRNFKVFLEDKKC